MISVTARQAAVVALSCSPLLLPSPRLHAYNSTQTDITVHYRRWTCWPSMGSTVDHDNFTGELTHLKSIGSGGAHIIPFYDLNGLENRAIPCLSSRWMGMLDYTLHEAARPDIQNDLTRASGWYFGGSAITDEKAKALVHHKVQGHNPGQSPSQPQPIPTP